MSSTIKLSLLALVSTAAAVPHYSHGRFHSSKASSVKAYPTGGWPGNYNSTAVPYPTGTGYAGEDKTTTLDTTSTSTQTVYSTVTVKPSGSDVLVENASTGQCGATITVTASEKVTITVTPGGGADVPTSSAAPVESKSDYGYGAPSSASSAVETPVAEESSKVVSSTTPAAEYPAETPVEATTSSAVEYPAETPVEKTTTPAVETPEASTSSKAVESAYITASYVQKPVESSSATPSATSTPSSGNTYTGAKRGLAYNKAELCKSFGSKFGFAYNWGQTENNDVGTEFVPMMHKPSDSTAEDWLANVDKAVAKGTKAVMGFNECDHAEQCNMEPAAACTAWKSYMNPIKTAHPDVTIVGPSVTNGGAPMGLDWLSRFHDACPDAVVDATNIHFYDIYEDATIDRFQAQVEKAADLYGKKVWITEFGLNPGSASEEEAATFLKAAMEYLDGSDKVQGYSWFMVGDGENQLNSGDGLSAVGKVYAGAA